MSEQRTVWPLAVLSLAAGLLHASVIGAHEGQGQLPLLFAGAAVIQAGWALLVIARPSRGVLIVGGVLNAAFFGFYVITRITGLPLDGLRTSESVGTKDLFTAAIELALVALIVLALVPNAAAWRRLPLGVAAVLGVAFTLVTVPALALGHGSSGHSHGDEAAAGHEHAEGEDHEHAEGEGEAYDHGTERAIDGVTPEQQAAADELVDATGASLPQWADTAEAEADGFVSIGDGRRSGYEHFINAAYLADPDILDPEHPESLVYEIAPDGTKTLASAMYILPPGSTMDDVPDVGGSLTVWHDHQNLCWNDTGQIAGVLVDGTCRPGGVLRVSPPMLHVWVVENPCGPFAGIDDGATSHGDSCDHTH
jgi:hypothetical protein